MRETVGEAVGEDESVVDALSVVACDGDMVLEGDGVDDREAVEDGLTSVVSDREAVMVTDELIDPVTVREEDGERVVELDHGTENDSDSVRVKGFDWECDWERDME